MHFTEQMSIMLVEDDEVDITGLKRIFEKLNIKNPLYIAKDGFTALNMLKGTHGYAKLNPLPKIILLDINMPKMNGLEVLEKIRQEPELKSISVYMLTTSDEAREVEKAYTLNVAGYIVKPIVLEEFVKSVSILNYYWNLNIYTPTT